jgi:succinyl-diaminopimelate desuccinylase
MPESNTVVSPTLTLTKELIARSSVTPDDAGCQSAIAERLSRIGFITRDMPFKEVTNLWAKHGSSSPLIVFAGHTDVVPTGNLEEWQSSPFEPTVRDGYLYGRGAADMKGSIAAMMVAVEQFLKKHSQYKGSIAFLLTSDEEGPGVNGTLKVLEKVIAEGEKIEYCIVGEPSSADTFGDTIKIGRRGSLTGTLKVKGVQGHVAYPDLAVNPIHRFSAALAQLCETSWDSGDEFFPPTTFQFSNIHSGVGASNVIPSSLDAVFNLRFSPKSPADSLKEKIEGILMKHKLDYEVAWNTSGQPFLTPLGELSKAVQGALQTVIGREAIASTSGGTSDARFFAPYGIQVVELGPINATIHKVNERVSIAELDKLTAVYEKTLENLLT